MTDYRHLEEQLGLLSNGIEMKRQVVFLSSRRKLQRNEGQ